MPEIAYWLGLDVGTGGSRALLVDDRGAVAHSFTAPHEEITMQHPLWAEQRPENWWDASRSAIRGVLQQAGVSGSAVRGVGLSGQMHGLTLLDAAGRVIRPALIWCDQRSQQQVDWVNETAGAAFVVGGLREVREDDSGCSDGAGNDAGFDDPISDGARGLISTASGDRSSFDETCGSGCFR